MPTDLSISLSTVVAFVLVLARMGGVFVFAPLPGVSAAPAASRVVLSVSCTFAVVARWPRLNGVPPALGTLLAWLAAEAAFGIAIGLAIAFVLEAFVMGAQLLSVQAGFSYASTIDPTTQADSPVLMVIAQLTAGMLFFALGLDRRLLMALAASLEHHPPGSLLFTPKMGFDLIQLGAGVFTTAFRLVLPLMAFMLMLDLSLGLMGRLNAQLQLITLAFPVKILSLLGLFAFAVLLFPRAASSFIETCFALIARLTAP